MSDLVTSALLARSGLWTAPGTLHTSAALARSKLRASGLLYGSTLPYTSSYAGYGGYPYGGYGGLGYSGYGGYGGYGYPYGGYGYGGYAQSCSSLGSGRQLRIL